MEGRKLDAFEISINIEKFKIMELINKGAFEKIHKLK